MYFLAYIFNLAHLIIKALVYYIKDSSRKEERR
nr:MAG TPA: hypothetical protein [Herelleviridae sp.]